MPTPAEIIGVHAHIRKCLVARLGAVGKQVQILNGGSVKPSSAGSILDLPEVGGTSLKAADFGAISAPSRR